MNWFYALNNQQAGPVDDAELVRLVQTGVITGGTLIWHSGLPNWQTYDAVRLAAVTAPATTVPAAVLAPGEAQCSQCGRVFPADEVVRVGAYEVCAECKPVLLQKLRQGALSGDPNASAQPFAGFGIRLGAALLDSIILTPFFVVVYGAYFYYLFGTHFNTLSQPQSTSAILALQSIGIVFTLVLTLLLSTYSAFCVSRWGATPGKRICELRIVRGDGGPLTFWRAFGRHCAKSLPRVVPLLGLVYSLLDYVFIFSDAERRALHDQICDTRVIYDPKKR